MNTRSNRDADKDKIFYSLFDWGNSKKALPTESVKDQDANIEQTDRQTTNLERFEGDESILPVKSEEFYYKTSEGETPYRFPPFVPTEEDSNRPISPINKEVETNIPILNYSDEQGNDTQDYSAFLDDIDFCPISWKTKTEGTKAEDYSAFHKESAAKTKEFVSNRQELEWDHFLSLGVKDLISEEVPEGENRNVLDFFSKFIENSRLWREQRKQEEDKEKEKETKDFTLDFYTGLDIKDEKQEVQEEIQEVQTQTYNANMSDKFIDPKPFRGTPAEDPREWLEVVEAWLSYKNYANLPELETLPDEEEKKMIKQAAAIAKRRVPYALGSLLHGQAGTWFNSLEVADKETWVAFKEKFKARYIADKTNQYNSLVNVWEEKQKPNETVDTFYDNHVKLVKLAGMTTDANTNQAFVHGLLPHIKMQVIMQGKVDLREILEVARLAEIAYKAAVGKTAPQGESLSSSATTTKKTTKTEVSNVQETTSDDRTVKVLKELLESVVGATVGRTTPPTVTTPTKIHDSVSEVRRNEPQPDPDEQWRMENAQNWIGQPENKQTPQQPEQQRWQPQQQLSQPQQQEWQSQQQQQPQPRQQGWQPQQPTSQPQQGWQPRWQSQQQQFQPQQQRWSSQQPQQQAQGYRQQQSWQPRQSFQTQRPQQYGQQSGDSCIYCGRRHPPGRANCGMADKTCNNCGKLGHSYRVCRATNGQQPSQQQSQQNWRPRSSQGWQPRQQQPQNQVRMQSGNPTDTGQL